MVRTLLTVATLACALALPAHAEDAKPSAPAVPAASSIPASAPARAASTASPAAASGEAAVDPLVATRIGIELFAGFAGLALIALGAWLALGTLRDRRANDEPVRQATSTDLAWPAPPEGFAFRRHWGSFGGESTGWNLSPRLARLATGLAIAFAGVCLLWRVVDAVAPAPHPAAAESAKPGPAVADAK